MDIVFVPGFGYTLFPYPKMESGVKGNVNESEESLFVSFNIPYHKNNDTIFEFPMLKSMSVVKVGWVFIPTTIHTIM